MRRPEWLRPYRSRTANVLLAVLGALAVLTVVGLVDLWPDGRDLETPPGFGGLATEAAEVTAVEPGECRTVQTPACRRVSIRLESGPESGQEAGFDLSGPIDIATGDRVRVADSMLPPDATVGGVPADRYTFSDFERRSTLLWLTVAFAALVIITSRWQGLRALIGLAASLAIVAFFIVPAILEGREPVAVATIGALAVMLITIPLTHGLGPKAIAACLGTAAALGITLGLAQLVTDLAHITGFSSEEASIIGASTDEVSIQGLLLAGIVIAALGVLDDLTVTQASTVIALRRADPSLGGRRLFSEALSVGHDHIAATVNTLVLAYVGASLPVLLVFSLADTSFGDAINGEVVASEIVATLVGSIGLIAAVPITTGLAVLLATRVEGGRLGTDHAHAH